MTIYNILFPFLILVVLGVAIYILTKHLPEAVEQHEILEKEEKKRWWQVLLGKGENFLRSLRVLLLKLDNKLNESIKEVRIRKEEMGNGLKEYRNRRKNKTPQEEISVVEVDSPQIEIEKPKKVRKSIWNRKPIAGDSDKAENQAEVTEPQDSLGEENASGIPDKKISSAFQASLKKPFIQKRTNAVAEILKKTFTPTEIKVEKEQYWRKKEAMLIQSIVREPKNIGLYIQLGRLYSNQHNWKDARNAFLEVIKLDKTNIKAKEELKRIDKYLNEEI